MTTATKIARRKLSLLQLAAELSNVSKACHLMGYSRQQFYEIRRNYQTYGAEGLIDRLPGFKGPHPNRVDDKTEKAILDYCMEHPSDGCLKVAQQLALAGIQVFSFGRHLVVLLLIVHLLIGFRQLREVDYYRDDPLVLRLLGLRKTPDVSTISCPLSKMESEEVEKLRELSRSLVIEGMQKARLWVSIRIKRGAAVTIRCFVLLHKQTGFSTFFIAQEMSTTPTGREPGIYALFDDGSQPVQGNTNAILACWASDTSQTPISMGFQISRHSEASHYSTCWSSHTASR